MTSLNITGLVMCALLSYVVRTVGKRHGLSGVEWFGVYVWVALTALAALHFLVGGM